MRNSLLIIPLLLLFACKSEDKTETPDQLKSDQEVIDESLNISLTNIPNYQSIDFPNHYDPMSLNLDNTPADNPVTDKGAQLGRVLFYDVNLSINNTIACASCHKQSHGFSDNTQLSVGFEGGLTGAHSMRTLNNRFYQPGQMFWDRRANTLEDQVIMPIQNETEMGFTDENGGMDALIEKLEKLEYYPILFNQAFGDDEVSVERVQKALAQYVRSIVSIDSKYDEGFELVFTPGAPGGGMQQNFPNFTDSENRGKLIFLTPQVPGGSACAACHRPPTFALGPVNRSNGLDEGETTVFKSPSLKSVALESNFMHDGRFSTLEEVIEHYNTGVKPGPAVDPILLNNNGVPFQLGLSEQDKADLVAFLHTLTDEVVATDPKFSNPFK